MSICARRDGFRRISLGMFPMVRYTGYALFPRKRVNCVLSDEIMRGITVAPGRCSSRVVYSNTPKIRAIRDLQWACAPVLPTTNLLYASRYRCGPSAHDPHNGALAQLL